MDGTEWVNAPASEVWGWGVKSRFSGTALQSEAKFPKVSQRWKSNSDWNRLAADKAVLGRKNPSKILTVGKHFCNKEKQASTRSSTLGLKFQLLVSSSPRKAPPSLMGSLWSNYLLGPSALLVGDMPANISVSANIGACFPKPRLWRGRRIRVDILGLLWMQLLEAGCGWGWLCCHLKLQSC